jgi:hypothetical protein
MHLTTLLSFFSKREAKHFTVVSTTWRYENSVPLANQKRKESSDTYWLQDETENRTAFPFLPRKRRQNHNFPKKGLMEAKLRSWKHGFSLSQTKQSRNLNCLKRHKNLQAECMSLW